MYETYLTVVGTVITKLDRKRFADGTTKVSFRVACNERRFDRSGVGWTDGDSLYLSVNCWRDLADNVLASFVVGDPVIVRGRLVTREWEKDGVRRSMTDMEAAAVGPDLSRCTAKITRVRRGGASSDATAAALLAPDVLSSGGGSSEPGLSEPGAYESGPLSDPDTPAAEGDPWQTTRAGAVVGGAVGAGYADDDWPDGADEPLRGSAVEAAVGV